MWWCSRARHVGAAILGVTALALAAPVTAHAQATPPASSWRTEIQLLDRYVASQPDGSLALSAPAAVVMRVNPSHLAALRAGLATVNQKLAAGELVIGPHHRLVAPTATKFNVQWDWTGSVYSWWGVQYYFSEYWTLKIEGLANMGAGFAALCAVISTALGQPEIGLVCGIASAVLWFGAGWLQWADNGGGDVISETYTPFPMGGIWISGQ